MRTAEDYRRVYDSVDADPIPDNFKDLYRERYDDPPPSRMPGLPRVETMPNSEFYATKDGRYDRVPLTLEDFFRAIKAVSKAQWVQDAVASAEAEGRFHEDEPETPELHPGEYATLYLAMEWWALENGFVTQDEEGRLVDYDVFSMQDAALSAVFQLSTTMNYDPFEDAASKFSRMQYLRSAVLDGESRK